MDFIEKLSFSSGFNTILVIVDCLSKQAIFIPTHDTITSAELARLFVVHVFSKHGVLSHVTFNCGSEFVSHFFCSLGTVLDMRLHFTSGYYLEANRQIEQTNQTLEQYMRATRAEHSRRFLSLNYAIEWVTTHLQEIPQRIR